MSSEEGKPPRIYSPSVGTYLLQILETKIIPYSPLVAKEYIVELTFDNKSYKLELSKIDSHNIVIITQNLSDMQNMIKNIFCTLTPLSSEYELIKTQLNTKLYQNPKVYVSDESFSYKETVYQIYFKLLPGIYNKKGFNHYLNFVIDFEHKTIRLVNDYDKLTDTSSYSPQLVSFLKYETVRADKELIDFINELITEITETTYFKELVKKADELFDALNNKSDSDSDYD